MRVRSHSAASLTNFFQEASPRHFEKYLEPIVRGLLNLYQSQVLYAQDQALATLGEYLALFINGNNRLTVML